jgi:hypothetical protein
LKITTVWVEASAGIKHRYPAAEVDPQLADVADLANLHYHIAKFRLGLEVRHADREIELRQLRQWLLSCLSPEPIDFGAMSCEMIADWLHEKAAARYPGRAMEITVAEDAFVGATVRYDAEVTS